MEPKLPSSFWEFGRDLREDSGFTAVCGTGFGLCNLHFKVAAGLIRVKHSVVWIPLLNSGVIPVFFVKFVLGDT